MRIRSQKQLYFKFQSVDIPKQSQLIEIDKVLNILPGRFGLESEILKDLTPKGKSNQKGRHGMSAEQVLRALLLKTLFNLSYRQLEFMIKDSLSAREFMKLSEFSKGFSYKTLQSNIKLLREETLDLVNSTIKIFAKLEGIEEGKSIRTDGFSTESNIHYPTDWSLMNDSIRVLTRTMCRTLEDLGVPIEFTNHYRGSKKMLFEIHNSRNWPKRKKRLREMIKLTRKTHEYAEQALIAMKDYDGNLGVWEQVYLNALIAELEEFIPLVAKVIDQAHRRIVLDEKVPSDEKLVSIFETHADIIVKGQRDLVFGHKITITTGASGLILDVITHEGNPADSTLVNEVIENHKKFYSKAPTSAVFDGCYASDKNRDDARDKGVSKICFSKETEEKSSLTKETRRALRNFRAGIEATVSMLKRLFGLTRVMNKGWKSFKTTVQAAVLTYNLTTLARIRLTA